MGVGGHSPRDNGQRENLRMELAETLNVGNDIAPLRPHGFSKLEWKRMGHGGRKPRHRHHRRDSLQPVPLAPRNDRGMLPNPRHRSPSRGPTFGDALKYRLVFVKHFISRLETSSWTPGPEVDN